MAAVERLQTLAETHRAHGRYCESLRTYEKVFLIQRRRGLTLGVAETYVSISDVHVDQGKYQDALCCLSKAIDLRQALAPGSPSLAALFAKRGDVFRERNYIDEALQWYTKAHTLLLTTAPDSAARANVCVAIGGLFRPQNATKCRVDPRPSDTLTVLGDFEAECSDSSPMTECSDTEDSAEVRADVNTFRTEGNLGRKHLGIGDADAWALLWWSRAFLICEDQKLDMLADVGLRIGFAHYDRGEDDDADSWWNRALEIQKKSGPESIEVADMLQRIYTYCEATKRKTPLLEEASAIERKLVPNSSRLSQTLSKLGSARRHLPEGLRYLEEACKIDVALRPEDAAATQIEFAAQCEEDGEYEMALPWLFQASELQEKAGSTELADTLETIGGIYQELGDYPSALKWLKKCCEVQEPNSPELAQTCHRIGTLLHDHDTPEEALLWHHKARAIQEEHDAFSADLAETYESLSDVYGGQGLLSERVCYLKKRCVILQNSELDDPAELSLLYTSIGDAYEKLGDSVAATRWKQQAEEALDDVEEGDDYDDYEEDYEEDYGAYMQECDDIYGCGYDPYNKY